MPLPWMIQLLLDTIRGKRPQKNLILKTNARKNHHKFQFKNISILLTYYLYNDRYYLATFLAYKTLHIIKSLCNYVDIIIISAALTDMWYSSISAVKMNPPNPTRLSPNLDSGGPTQPNSTQN